MTEHSVLAVGAPLLARGVAQLGCKPGDRVEARLRVDGSDDVAVTADADRTIREMLAPEGPQRS